MWALEYIIILTVPINTSMFKSEFLIYMNFIVDRFWKYIYLYLIALLMCRLIFLKFFASILGGYRNFIVWNFLLIFYFIVLAFFFFLNHNLYYYYYYYFLLCDKITFIRKIREHMSSTLKHSWRSVLDQPINHQSPWWCLLLTHNYITATST